MEADGVIPDVIDEVPSSKLTVIYSGGHEVDFGKELTPTQVKDTPEVKWDADPNKYYVLSMVDPDAPSRQNPLGREINHWLVINIKGKDVSSGEVLADYRGSGAPKGSGLHRYVFLVYEQNGKLSVNEPTLPAIAREHRRGFSIRNFAKKYNLGKPLFGNFFNAQWDPYVDERRKLQSASN